MEGVCTTVRACTMSETSPWIFTFAATRVEDVTRGPNGTIYFAGTALPGAASGLLEHVPSSPDPRYYVAEASELGCDVRVCDLGAARESTDDIRLSHGDRDNVFVTWTEQRRLCVRDATDDSAPGAGCDQTALIHCSAAGALRDPSVVYDATPGDFLLTFRAAEAGEVTCQRAGETESTWTATPTSYAWGTRSQVNLPLGEDVDNVRLALEAGGRARVTGHCGGGMVDGLQCAPPRGFWVFIGQVSTDTPMFTGGTQVSPGAGYGHTSETMTAYPARAGSVLTLPIPNGNRLVVWQKFDTMQGDTISPSSQLVSFRSLETAIPSGADLFVSSGTTDADIGAGCPFGACLPGIPFAFYGILGNETGVRGGKLAVQSGEACRSARASGAFQMDDGTVVVGGDYTCGALGELPVGGTILQADQTPAMFLARMPAP
jgi:hypothetical protein